MCIYGQHIFQIKSHSTNIKSIAYRVHFSTQANQKFQLCIQHMCNLLSSPKNAIFEKWNELCCMKKGHENTILLKLPKFHILHEDWEKKIDGNYIHMMKSNNIIVKFATIGILLLSLWI